MANCRSTVFFFMGPTGNSFTKMARKSFRRNQRGHRTKRVQTKRVQKKSKRTSPRQKKSKASRQYRAAPTIDPETPVFFSKSFLNPSFEPLSFSTIGKATCQDVEVKVETIFSEQVLKISTSDIICFRDSRRVRQITQEENTWRIVTKEGLCIAWNTSRFNLIDTKECSRACCIILQDNENSEQYFVANALSKEDATHAMNKIRNQFSNIILAVVHEPIVGPGDSTQVLQTQSDVTSSDDEDEDIKESRWLAQS